MTILCITPTDPADFKNEDHVLWHIFSQPDNSIRCLIEIDQDMLDSVIASPLWVQNELDLGTCHISYLNPESCKGLHVLTLTELYDIACTDFEALGELPGGCNLPDGVYLQLAPGKPAYHLCRAPIIVSDQFIDIVIDFTAQEGNTRLKRYRVSDWPARPAHLVEDIANYLTSNSLVQMDDSTILVTFLERIVTTLYNEQAA